MKSTAPRLTTGRLLEVVAEETPMLSGTIFRDGSLMLRAMSSAGHLFECEMSAACFQTESMARWELQLAAKSFELAG